MCKFYRLPKFDIIEATNVITNNAHIELRSKIANAFEFLKFSENKEKVFEFYEKYSKVFPNYVALPGESKYMFKNIERKQKLIDEKH
jgi:hypothetical protein